MNGNPFFHGTFTINRTWAASPARVFSAWADPLIKAEWFIGPPGLWTLKHRSVDFAVGGTEVLEGLFNETGILGVFKARYHLIEPERRVVYCYDLHHGGQFHSVTLSSLLLEPAGAGTRVSYTEQITFLNGSDGTESRRQGTEWQFAAIAKVLQVEE